MAACGLQVMGINRPEQQIEGQLKTTELCPGSALQPGRLLRFRLVQRDTWKGVSCDSKNFVNSFTVPH